MYRDAPTASTRGHGITSVCAVHRSGSNSSGTAPAAQPHRAGGASQFRNGSIPAPISSASDGSANTSSLEPPYGYPPISEPSHASPSGAISRISHSRSRRQVVTPPITANPTSSDPSGLKL